RLLVPGESTPTKLPFVGEDGLMPVVSRPQDERARRLVYVRSFQNYNTWRVETSGPGATALSPPAVSISSTRRDFHPQLSPDGRRVAFGSDRSGEEEVWLTDRRPAHGHGCRRRLPPLVSRWRTDRIPIRSRRSVGHLCDARRRR